MAGSARGGSPAHGTTALAAETLRARSLDRWSQLKPGRLAGLVVSYQHVGLLPLLLSQAMLRPQRTSSARRS